MIDAIVEKIEKLPPVPSIVHELQDMFYMDNYNVVDIEKVIRKDPALVSNILKFANAPLYGFAREIVDIRQAIALFGLEKIIEFALASYVDKLGAIDLDLYGITTKQFLLMAQNKSKVASTLIQEKKSRFVLSNTAFLCDVSKVILSQYAKEKKISFQVDPDIALNALDHIEHENLGVDSIEVAEVMFDAWNFNEAMIILLRNFKKRQNEINEALYLARELVSLDGNINKERGEDSSLASRLARL